MFLFLQKSFVFGIISVFQGEDIVQLLPTGQI